MATLIERLGGEPGLQRIIDDAYVRIFQNDELRPFFENTDMDKLRRMQRVFLEAALTDETTQESSGISIREAHHGRKIARRHFTQFVECFLQAMESRGEVKQEDIDAVIGRLNMYAEDVIGSSTVDG